MAAEPIRARFTRTAVPIAPAGPALRSGQCSQEGDAGIWSPTNPSKLMLGLVRGRVANCSEGPARESSSKSTVAQTATVRGWLCVRTPGLAFTAVVETGEDAVI